MASSTDTTSNTQKPDALTAPIDVEQLVRSIRSHDPRVTHFPIHWDTQTSSSTQDMAVCGNDNNSTANDVSMPLVASTAAETSALMNDDSSDDDCDNDIMMMKVCADSATSNTKSQQKQLEEQQHAQQMAIGS
jgi:hypothetical protein